MSFLRAKLFFSDKIRSLPEWRNLPAGRQVVAAHELYIVYTFGMFYTYAIQSTVRKYVYVGLTSDLGRRLEEHNSGKNKTTRPYTPFVLIYSEEHPNRATARAREKYFKSGIGKEFLHSLSKNAGMAEW